MDRDKRWDRIEARLRGDRRTGWGSTRRPPTAAIEAAYARGENDEFVLPTVIDGVDGRVRDGDPIIHANFRADRARQLSTPWPTRRSTASIATPAGRGRATCSS